MKFDDISPGSFYVISDAKNHPEDESIVLAKCIKFESPDTYTFNDINVIKRDFYNSFDQGWEMDKESFDNTYKLRKVNDKTNPELFL